MYLFLSCVIIYSIIITLVLVFVCFTKIVVREKTLGNNVYQVVFNSNDVVKKFDFTIDKLIKFEEVSGNGVVVKKMSFDDVEDHYSCDCYCCDENNRRGTMITHRRQTEVIGYCLLSATLIVSAYIASYSLNEARRYLESDCKTNCFDKNAKIENFHKNMVSAKIIFVYPKCNWFCKGDETCGDIKHSFEKSEPIEIKEQDLKEIGPFLEKSLHSLFEYVCESIGCELDESTLYCYAY